LQAAHPRDSVMRITVILSGLALHRANLQISLSRQPTPLQFDAHFFFSTTTVICQNKSRDLF